MKWWQIRKRDADLERELRSDLELEEEEQRENGLPPEEARYAARRALGNDASIKEETHEAWGWAPFERLFQDVRFALRQLTRFPGFTITAMLLLCLGIGAVTAVFSLVDATLFRPLPYKDSQQLMELARTSPQFDHPVAVSGANFLDWQQRSHTFSAMAAYGGSRMTRFDPSSGPEMVHAMRVSPNFFSSVLQVRPEYGRDFRTDEDQPQSSRVVLLSHAVAEQWFGNAAQAVGTHLTLDSQPFAVIGVLPKSFRFELTSTADLWMPATILPDVNRGSNAWAALGRISQGVSLSEAQTEMNLIGMQLAKEFPKEDADQGIAVIPYLNWMNRGGNDRLVLIFFAAVLLVLLISIANLAGLIVARYADHRKQIAVRIALGASRTRIIRMLLVENLILSFLGGLAGVGLSFVLTSVFRSRLSAVPLVRADLIRIDAPMLVFALALSLVTAALFGLGPALGASRLDLNSGLKGGGITEAGHYDRTRSRSVLIVAEIALSLVLVAGAGLLLRSIVSVLHTDPGYDPRQLLTLWIMPPQQRYPTEDSLTRLYDAILQKVDAIPGVQSAAISNTLPPMGNEVDGAFIVENRPPHDLKNAPVTILDAVSPNFFATMKIPLIHGRPFNNDDNHPDSPKTVIVSQSLAQYYFPGENPIGQRMKFDADGFANSWIVVGVVADTRYFGWDHDEGIFSYFPFATLGGRNRIGLAVRTEMNPATITASVEHAVWSVDRQLPLFDIASMNRKLSDSFAPRRFNTFLLGSFAATAIFLAGIGIFGLLANLVARRRREIGVRMALGARRSDVLWGILAHSVRLAFCGISIGLPIALLGGQALRGLLYDTKPIDPLVLSTAAAIMFLVALLASYLPARRAASVDPIQALRTE